MPLPTPCCARWLAVIQLTLTPLVPAPKRYEPSVSERAAS